MTRVPPGIDEGKTWPFRLVEWRQKDGMTCSVMIPPGTDVQEPLHEHYWDSVDIFTKIIAAWERRGKKCPRAYGLLDINSEVKGTGVLLPTDGPAEMAWLDCLFAEMRRWKMGMEMPADIEQWEISSSGKLLAVVTQEARS